MRQRRVSRSAGLERVEEGGRRGGEGREPVGGGLTEMSGGDKGQILSFVQTEILQSETETKGRPATRSQPERSRRFLFFFWRTGDGGLTGSDACVVERDRLRCRCSTAKTAYNPSALVGAALLIADGGTRRSSKH